MSEPIYNRKTEQAATVTSKLTTYTLSPEELARYGPVAPRKKNNNQFHARVMNAIKVSGSPEEAAELLNITVNSLKQYLGARNIFPRWGVNTEEVADMVRPESVPGGRLEFLKTKLTKDLYLAYKEKKLSDPEILKKVAINKPSWIATLTALKKEWGLSGLNLKAPETMTTGTDQDMKRATEAVGVFLGQLGLAFKKGVDLGPGPDYTAMQTGDGKLISITQNDTDTDDEVEWATPFKPVDKRPILTVNAKHMCINTSAQKELEGVDAVLVGVSKRGVLVIREDSGPNTYKVSRNEKYIEKGSSAKIGGGTLIKFLKSRGVQLGKYVLMRNEVRGWWEAGAMDTTEVK
ncbi:MAG: hypothetical protein JL50_03065 [Peptococcaceae bacterium BICA1-7]|nr:MAG: hypothetical protein JL50_03065 [Peptococcaceae bacterium BICA1-7]HBV97755.1 hypothetical protein [Desulfotomaculum sp.]